jgi:hypothetical protein
MFSEDTCTHQKGANYTEYREKMFPKRARFETKGKRHPVCLVRYSEHVFLMFVDRFLTLTTFRATVVFMLASSLLKRVERANKPHLPYSE